jgi:hypothetical protein
MPPKFKLSMYGIEELFKKVQIISKEARANGVNIVENYLLTLFGVIQL